MATKTSNYEFNKPEQNDFYDVDVQNENWDKVDEELSEFDDSGVTEDIKSFPDFLSKFVTGNKVAITLRNLKAGLQFVLHAGQIVNNCVTDNAGLPLSAAQGKALMDKYTQLYSDMQAREGLYYVRRGGTSENVQFKPITLDGQDGMIFTMDGDTNLMVNVWKNGKFGSQRTLATKDDLTPTLEEIAQPSVSGITFSQWVATAEKSGNEVTLSFNVNGNMTAMSSIVKILTLPTKYRPKSNKYVSYATQEGCIMLLAIYTDGTLNLFNNNKTVSGFFLRQAITYPVA